MRLAINGISYHVEVKGSGAPLVLLHGFTGSVETWKPFVNDWKDSFTLILIDIIGHGKTDSPIAYSRYSMEHSVEDVVAILDVLEIDKVNLLGYSMGGRLALSIAAAYPNRICKLLLESSSPGLRTNAEKQARIISDTKLANDILAKGVTSFVNYWESIPLFISQKNLIEAQRLHIRNERLGNNPTGLANSLKGMGTGSQPSWWEHLKTLHFPVLLLCGSLDQKYCQIAGEMNNCLPNSTIYQIDDAGHAIHVEQPKIFGKIVSEFFKN